VILPGGAWGTADEALTFQGEDQVMYGGCRDLEVVLKIALYRRSTVELSVSIDEGQILALGRVKAGGVVGGSSGMKIAFFPDFAERNGEVNVRYRVELSEVERAELKGLVSGGKQPVRRLKRAQILLASDVGQSEEAIART
jgi:hypothetical protein